MVPPEKLKQQIDQVSAERMEICSRCEYNSVNAPEHTWVNDLYEHCTLCGCPLKAKTKCLSADCDVKRWMAVMTYEQEQALNIEDNGTQERSQVEDDSPGTIHRDADGSI